MKNCKERVFENVNSEDTFPLSFHKFFLGGECDVWNIKTTFRLTSVTKEFEMIDIENSKGACLELFYVLKTNGL